MKIKQLQYSDTELFLLLKTRETKYFNYIYDFYSPVLYGFLLNSGLSEKYSADILKETFVKIWNNPSELPSHNNFLLWLLQITIENIKNYLQNHHRKFTIEIKNCAAISIKFTDVIEPALTNQSIA
ncbi:RNA polymerase sigma factor [Chryseobacterium luquanense]|uniref:RNA polymerase sigma-70 region 2 domain-containing protein n=1 Tax=Chryseobacterium luquanense TaxID=2983766 RepID=A0ABT3XXZ6_9FLAO|nr:hypothetical protein [Chryseobacterium luquanense]MCX8530773.1 hypothetical protein [Chryseobacterium luquanense]